MAENFIKRIASWRAVFYLMGIAVFLLSVLYEKPRGIIGAAILAGIAFISWIYGMTIKRQRTLKNYPVPGISKQACRRILCLTVLLSFCGFVFVFYQEETLVQSVYQMEGTMYRLLRQISGSADEAVTSGSINRGNNYRTGTVQLELGTAKRPTESIYLRGFSGGEYKNSEWEAADEDALLQDVVETLHWQEWLDLVWNMYYSMYFALSTDPTERMDPDARLLSIRPAGERLYTFYTPYYSRWSRRNEREQERNEAEYYFEYYQQENVSIDWEKQQEYLAEAADWYRELQREYQKEIEKAYTNVPFQDLPRLTQLVEKQPLEELDEITAFIITTLREHAAYTLTPGRIPVNQETVEYFLFESNEGYCQHFATAAALMYRMYGIPARYAAGYRIEPEAFTKQGDGRWNAEVTDESAHAWVEIFLEDYGWTPVEVTPASDGSIAASYPGLDTEYFQELLGDMEGGLPVSARTSRETEAGNDMNGWKIPDLSKYREIFQMLGILLLYTVLLLPVFLDYRRFRRLERLGHTDCGKVYARWMEMLHFCGMLREYHGLEDRFPSVAKDITGISFADLVKMQEIIRESIFSPRTPGSEEEGFLAEQYFRSAHFLKKQQKGIRKIIFSYWKNYG